MCSLAGSNLGVSSSERSLSESEMNSLPRATSPRHADDTEVLSQRTPGQGETQEAVKAAPEGETLAVGHMGEQIPMDTDDGGVISNSAPSRIQLRRPIRLRN